LKILVIANSLQSVYRFRYWMLKKLALDGHDVVIACPFDVELHPKHQSISYINIKLDGKSTSVFNNLSLIARFVRIAFNVKPDLCLFYSNKPALFAPIAFKLIKTSTVSINTGFGSGFLMLKGNPRILNKIFYFFYSFANYVVVLNDSDYAYLINSVKLKSNKVVRLPGEGIDLDKFKYNNLERDISIVKFVFIGRLITDKGVKELIKASKMLYEKYPEKFQLKIVGSIDVGHPKSINDQYLNSIKNLTYIEHIPYSDNISEILFNADVFVLPSYREGLSVSAMEACSVGRPLIVSDVPGLAELVNNGINGFLCNPRDHSSLFDVMRKFMNINKNSIFKMGRESHALIANHYDLDSVYKVFNNDILQKIATNEKSI
jgi:glycosyltransferase involved in cell wall biosynthesis